MTHKGRTKFSEEEAQQIKTLLAEKNKTYRERQKAIRAELRLRYDFWISRFGAYCRPFGPADFDRQVHWGQIRVG